MPTKITPRDVDAVFKERGPKGFLKWIRLGLEKDSSGKRKLNVEDISFRALADTLGVFDRFAPLDPTHLRESMASPLYGHFSPEKLVNRAHAEWETIRNDYTPEAITTSIFPVVTGELLSSVLIEAYESAPSVAQQLVTVQRATVRNQKMAGFTSLGGGAEVAENNPYTETGFDEKYVVTKETKRGRILSISEELIMFDQTGEILNRARMLADYLRQDWERTVIRGVIDADSGSGVYVWRPSGTGATLYNTNGSNKNYIGSGGVTGFDAASPLVDWTDIDHIRKYRATKIKDDRTDGTQLPIGMVNTGLTLLVPESIRGTADSIVNATEVVTEGATSAAHQATKFGNPVKSMVSTVVSSPYVDEVNADDYYIGQFSRQFVWTELMPLQTFLQGAQSESAFERDIAFRIKARYYGGLTARDSIYVTKVDGA